MANSLRELLEEAIKEAKVEVVHVECDDRAYLAKKLELTGEVREALKDIEFDQYIFKGRLSNEKYMCVGKITNKFEFQGMLEWTLNALMNDREVIQHQELQNTLGRFMDDYVFAYEKGSNIYIVSNMQSRCKMIGALSVELGKLAN